ncbi:MAG: glycosyltransferase [Lachnospiraceae bacterium]|nr:glycosyltransferase [Lachnospiraceae bacterium]
MSDARIAVLVVTYNRIALLRECVDAVLGQTHAASALYIVDNHSEDGTAEYLEELACQHEDDTCHPERRAKPGAEGSLPPVRVITSDKNLGGAGGFELGVRTALSEGSDFGWLVLIDDDAILAPDFLEKMAAGVDAHPKVRLFAGAVKCRDNIDTNHRRRIKNRLIFSEEWVPEREYATGSFFCDMATFCGLMISREMMEEAGAPRGDYFIWYDDTEYCLRCGRVAAGRGYEERILVLPEAVTDHRSQPVEAGGDILMRTDWRSRYGWANRYDVARRYLGALTAFTVKCEYRILRLKSRIMALSSDEKIRGQGQFNVKMIGEVFDAIGR